MPYVIQIQPRAAEEVLLDLNVHISNKLDPFRFVVSNQALYVPRKKWIALSDPNYFERVPLSDVQTVAQRRLPPFGWWIFAAILFLVGATTTCLMLWPIIHGEGGKISGFPPALAITGLVLPFAVKGRRGVYVAMQNGSYAWKPPIVFDKAAKERIRNAQVQLLDACRKVGIRIVGT